MVSSNPLDSLTIVTPTFEKHAVQFTQLVSSLNEHCTDIDRVHLLVVIERVNQAMFEAILDGFPHLSSSIIHTEDILDGFGVEETPAKLLRRVGKFTFQTLKKLGALRRPQTTWSLVLDSEGLFHKPFRATDLLRDYAERKYVFYTRTKPRTDLWQNSTGFQVTRNAAIALAMDAGDRWYMEYFHWFYETEKVIDLLDNKLWASFYDVIREPSRGEVPYFENILYYLYLEKYHATEYTFIDLKAELDALLPPEIASRFNLSELPFSLFGNEYILNILAPGEVATLAPLFDKYRLPFVRLEPPFFNTCYLPALKALPTFVATISSHHLMWLRKKIAVCVSGEFRHSVHRNPEGNLRHLMGFLSGVECDIFVHGWSNSSEALILNELNPRAHLFEPRPSVSGLARRIRLVEPNIKPGRDEGSLAMFYSLEACYKLVEPYRDEYDFVLRIRPDMMADRSLKEMLVAISDEGDYLPGAIYVPQHFHSKGINDQIAVGPVSQMAVYMTTFSWVSRNIEDVFFNPETLLLRHLLENKVEIALVHLPYALMRHHPMRIDVVHQHIHDQHHVWWSRTDRLPLLTDVTDFFHDKLRAVETLMRGQLPPVLYLDAVAADAPSQDGGSAQGMVTIRARVVDNDPALWAVAFFERFGLLSIGRFSLTDGGVAQREDYDQHYLFAFLDGEDLVVSEWRLQGAKLVNNVLRSPLAAVESAANQDGIRRRLAWVFYRLGQRHHERARRWRSRRDAVRVRFAQVRRLALRR